MKRLLLFIITSGFCLGTALATLEVSSSSYNVQSGQAYQASLSYGVYDGGSATLSKLNSSGWHWLADGWGSPFVDLSAWTSDTGQQTVEIWGEGWDDTWGEYESNMVEVVVGGVSNTPPVPSVVVDGYTHGATVTRPVGGSVNVTVRFRATDANGNLTGIRPQVWDPAGNLNNNNGNFVAKTGSSGEVAWTVTLNQNGNWYFWTDAQDATIAPDWVNSGPWESGFRLNVVEAAPVPTITSATAVSGSIVSACSYQITATNSPTSYTASGLPAGLTLNTASGLVSGTPTTAGVYVATIGAVNAHGTGTVQVTFSIGSGTWTVVGEGYCYFWNYLRLDFSSGRAMVNAVSAPQAFRDMALSIISDIESGAIDSYTYSYNYTETYTQGPVTAEVEFVFDPEIDTTTAYFVITGPDHPLPVSFSFGDLTHTYDGVVKSATVVVSPSYATYAADLARGPAAGTYTVTATATGAYTGSGAASLEITKASQLIIFNDPGERPVESLLTLAGSASSGLPVNFSVLSGPALLSDGVVSFTDVGRVTITASQVGDNNYLPAVAVTRAFFVTTGNPQLDSDGDGVPDDIEIKIGLNRNNGLDCRVYNYVYDKTNRLITGPGGKYIMDTEGNIKEVKP